MSSRHQVALDRVRDNLLDVMGETVRGLMAEPDVTDIILNPPLARWSRKAGCGCPGSAASVNRSALCRRNRRCG